MATWQGLRKIAIVTACINADGTPTFALNEVNVTEEQAANGIHYYVAEGQLLIDGYEEPFVHFDEDEAPAFLHAAVRRFLGRPAKLVKHSCALVASAEET
jgi:hypothetical protein